LSSNQPQRAAVSRRYTTVKLATAAIMTAISCVLILIITIPFPLMPAFKYDFADIPIFIMTFAYGPVTGLLMTGICAMLQAFVLGQDSWMGFAMHFFSTGGFVIVAGLIYKHMKTKKGAVIALICGTLTMTVLMCILNYTLDPIFYGMTKEAVAKLMLPAVIPFNLSKAGINSLITFLIYKRISNLIHRREQAA
jgi:riboflavin transporter FmnP